MLARLNGHTGMRRWRWLWASLLCLLVLPSTALSYSTASGFAASDYATGFPSLSCCGWGPLGITFDQSDNLYVVDQADGHLYRFAPGGGQVEAATRVTGSRLRGRPTGLAITRDGHLYLARSDAGDVVEVDQASGRILRTVAGGMRCATGLAADPVSGDLFVSQISCGGTLWRISGFANGPGTA